MAELNYGLMMQRAMQGLVADALRVVAQHGLPGDHHFYITLKTSHPGVVLPDWLRASFPDELVIVLQHEFEDLAVADDRFSVRLSFDDRPATLTAPFDAILQFADPSAEFGLRFDPPAEADLDDEELDQEGDADEPSVDAAEESAPEGDAAPPRPSGDVVSLDAFRKK